MHGEYRYEPKNSFMKWLDSRLPIYRFVDEHLLARSRGALGEQRVDGAADHVRDQGPSGATGHTGSDGSTMSARIERHGQWGGGISENIDYGSADAREVVISLVVDDGVSSRGHRRNLLDPAIRFAGAACGPHQRYRTMCVMDHAGSFAPNEAAPSPSGKPRRR